MSTVRGRFSLKRRESGSTSRCRIVGGTNLTVGVDESGNVVDANLWTTPSTAPRLWPEAYLTESSAPILQFKKIDWYLDDYRLTNDAGAIDTNAPIGGGLAAGQCFELVAGGGFSGSVILRLKREFFGTIHADRTVKFVGVVVENGSDIILQATISTNRYLVASNVYDPNIVALDGHMFSQNQQTLRFTPELRYGGVAVTAGVTFEWGFVVANESAGDIAGGDIADGFQPQTFTPYSGTGITLRDEDILGNGAVLALRAKLRGEYVGYAYQPIVDVEDPLSLQLSASQPTSAVQVGPGVSLTLSIAVMQGTVDVTPDYLRSTWSWAVLRNPGANQELVQIPALARTGKGLKSVTYDTVALFDGSPEGPDLTVTVE